MLSYFSSWNKLINPDSNLNNLFGGRMDKLQFAITYFEDAILESDEIIAECTPRLQSELKKQKGYFDVALNALRKQNPQRVIPIKRIPKLCKCPVCKTELCRDDEDLHYCPACGQALQI